MVFAQPKPEVDTVYLVDASIYIFQAYFSPYTECYDKENNDLSAVYGFIRFLLQFLGRTNPSYMAIARDESLFCGFRHKLCPNYKSNRELPDENLQRQLEGCAQACSLMGLPHFASKEFEADDILGTLAKRFGELNKKELSLCIVSKDKDLAQLLIAENSCLWDYSGNRKRYRQDIYHEYGVYPEQFPDYLGLIGDSVDVISGVPGIGPVKAKAMLQAFPSIEAIYENLDSVSRLTFRGAKTLPKVLRENREKASLSKILATIECNVTDPAESFSAIDLQDICLRAPDMDGFTELLQDLQFRDEDLNSLLYQFNKLNERVN